MKKEVLDRVRDLLMKSFPNHRIVSHRLITEEKDHYIIDYGFVYKDNFELKSHKKADFLVRYEGTSEKGHLYERDLVKWMPLQGISLISDEYREIFRGQMHSPLCWQDSMEYRTLPITKGELEGEETHFWVCEHCPSVVLEYPTYRDSQNLFNALN